ncbi:hypothetical protein D9756_007008 [Leucocoprinus leucothites]|uniref:Uncharacterized protein n=1 Tax=Leucocoprinus leucothites TaxID=201217 RepID=A0A8H5FZA3_9AGAR|nr:hypothetical protein D9756_007008 [Leucoagaricus leucothites]
MFRILKPSLLLPTLRLELAMSPLPKELPLSYRHVSQFVSAYDTCLRVENDLTRRAEKNGQDVMKQLIYIRILGFLLHHSPSQQGLKTVEVEINSCAGEDARLLQLGKNYFDHYIRAFRTPKGPIPTPSSHPSRPSFDTIADMINDTLVEAPQSHADAKKNASLLFVP